MDSALKAWQRLQQTRVRAAPVHDSCDLWISGVINCVFWGLAQMVTACAETLIRTHGGAHSWLYGQLWLLYTTHLAASVAVVVTLPRACTAVLPSCALDTRTFFEYGDYCIKHTFYWLFVGLMCVYMVAVAALLSAFVFANTVSVIVAELTALLTVWATWRFLLW